MHKRGVLLINLGSPDSPSVPDVRKYLREFLMDGRVIDMAWPLRFALVNFAIIPKRAHASAEAYQSIWTEAGSPLVVTSRNVTAELRKRIDAPIELAMRYQSPSIEEAVNNLVYQGVTELLVIPLFPHYAMSSFETAAERAIEVAFEQAPHMSVKVIDPYYDHPDYMHALVESAKPYLARKFDHLLFSFHGLPERHLRLKDPKHPVEGGICCDEPSCYRSHCLKTARAFVNELPAPHSVAFQSRLGKEPWMKPYTDVELERLAKSGVKKLAVICPAFVSDCLETIEEIGMRGKEIFLGAGGEEFTLIPCLNEHPAWIAALEHMIGEFIGPRPIPASEPRSELVPAQ